MLSVINAVLFQTRENPADDLIHVGDHVSKLRGAFIQRIVIFRLSGLRERRRINKRRVDQGHRVVDEEGLVLVIVNELEQELAVDVRPEILFTAFDDLPVLIDVRTVIAACLISLIEPCPQAIAVETVLDRLTGKLVELAELPFARNGGLVSGLSEVMPEGLDVRWQDHRLQHAEQALEPGPIRIEAAHEHDPRGRAQGRCVGIVETHAFRRHAIQIRRAVNGAAVATQPLRPEVVGHDHDDIGPRCGKCAS